MESVLDLCTQAGRAAGYPLAQRGLGDAVVFDLGVALRVCAHPQLEKKDIEEQVRPTDGHFSTNQTHYRWGKTKY